MAESKPQETQRELFGEFSREADKAGRFPALSKNQKPILITTSLEQVLLTAILLILAACFIYFLGMLRGRSLAGHATALSPPIARPAPGPAGPSSGKVIGLPRQKKEAAPVSSFAADPGKPYTIQLATYKKQSLAEKEMALLRRAGYYSAIIPSGDYYQVCVGQYGSMEEAKKDLRFFGSRYKDRFLRRR